ncbi:uncharacterized protein LOC129773929 [Toxorhynchites rutilus septentrionalis]|uniref:uncharacterized protein LOC129773929 n=1 Tax=Toxorhynchites rutilus septentrionalis TaxID=329112 RepID=UPI00247A0B8C|nr:uncharacterized protein LOC129773929 [Toxorhynchites rutilus septentrionalis]
MTLPHQNDIISKSGEVNMSIPESDCNEIGGAVLKSFITTYEKLHVLWNPTDPNYKNKIKRNAALIKLQAIYVKCKPGATLSDVRRKINTLRSNYRKELNKIEESKRSGAATDNVYIPSSWVFHALKFLNILEQPADHWDSQILFDVEMNDEEDEKRSQIQATPSTSRSSIVPPPEPVPKRARNIDPIARQNKLLQKACAYLDYRSNSNAQTEIPTIAKAWGEKLLQLHPQQRDFAEKAINDILFEASQGTLYRNSVKIEVGFPCHSSSAKGSVLMGHHVNKKNPLL